jgi:hypothetical protein
MYRRRPPACQGSSREREQAFPSQRGVCTFLTVSRSYSARHRSSKHSQMHGYLLTSLVQPVVRESWSSSTMPTGNWRARPLMPCSPTTTSSSSQPSTEAEGMDRLPPSTGGITPCGRRWFLLCTLLIQLGNAAPRFGAVDGQISILQLGIQTSHPP